MSRRVIDEKIELDYENIQKFFEQRGENKQLQSKYNYVLFQDDCPEVAEQRDLMEKEKIAAILDLKGRNRILDIGCGIGRWGGFLLGYNGGENYYVGIDGSKKMIGLAEENLKDYSEKKLLVGNFQQLPEVLKQGGETEKFNKVFVNGVFMYLNDSDYERALDDIYQVCSEHCEIYIKESMGIERRLTLQDIYSESLSQNYSAIYRSIEEYRESLSNRWKSKFKLIAEGKLFDEKLTNRAETTDYYFIWKC